MAILADAAPLAVEAPHIVLDEDAVTLGETVPLLEPVTRVSDDADVLVAHDHGPADHGGRIGVHLHVGAADAGDFHLQERGVGIDLRQVELAHLGGTCGYPDSRLNLLRHQLAPSPEATAAVGKMVRPIYHGGTHATSVATARRFHGRAPDRCHSHTGQ